ncbi:flagellar export chaperone FliS [Aquabacterium sp.]|uniref:flagellar export chaperone FliS n=1 Tax=Aquabacterium sp. TaxID=1872578 RepID=UPI002E2F71CC|nr:flagellar export chaperone FliS [Aquabacterium sp.]
MFSSKQMSSVYRQIDIETGVSGASAHQLITLLFNGALDSIAQAKGAMQARNIEAKCAAVSKTVRIVDEGLKAGLDMRAGGELAQHLNDLYGYIVMRLTQANLRNDINALDECARLLTPIRDAWVTIAPADATVVRAAMEVHA